MKELKESLDKSSHPIELDIDDGWGDLIPSLDGIDLVGSFDMEDIRESSFFFGSSCRDSGGRRLIKRICLNQ